MLRSLNTAVSGLQQFQDRMDVIGNNVANVNTNGYKAARVDFADAFSQTLQFSSSGAGSMQIGSGVGTAAIKSIHTQGTISQTGVEADLAISGPGFFMVRDTASNAQYATRAGDFRRDNNGYLITNSGQRVQGFSDSGLSTRGDIQIDGTGRPSTSDPAATMKSYAIDGEGKINVYLTDGTQFTRGQVLLQDFGDPQALIKEANNLYSGLSAAGPLGGSASPTSAAPGTNGLGKIQARSLELSNVDLTNEFANLITTQRAFQASARIMTTGDELLQEIVNLKR
ncbi:MAG: flagellar hook-basal body complex protein [Chloroflexi bacterium]|nr:flagellar hook-basal body complex protein [Chloroflexota bacterium]